MMIFYLYLVSLFLFHIQGFHFIQFVFQFFHLFFFFCFSFSSLFQVQQKSLCIHTYIQTDIYIVCVCMSLSHVQLFATHGLQPTRLLCPWNSPGKNTAVACHSLLQGIFPSQGLNPGLLHSSKFFTIRATRELYIVCKIYILQKTYEFLLSKKMYDILVPLV